MTWNRLIASTLAFFALMTGVLAWRVQTGHDPAVKSASVSASSASSSSPLVTRSSTAPSTTSPSTSSPSLSLPSITTHES